MYGAITRGLIRKPKIVLIARSMTCAECEQAQRCGIFAVLEAPWHPAMIEWTVILAKRSTRNPRNPPQAAPSSRVPKFDIFAGAPDKDTVWVRAVPGLANARETMERIAAEKPGRYFIFYAPDRNVLSQIETFPSAAKKTLGKSA